MQLRILGVAIFDPPLLTPIRYNHSELSGIKDDTLNSSRASLLVDAICRKQPTGLYTAEFAKVGD